MKVYNNSNIEVVNNYKIPVPIMNRPHMNVQLPNPKNNISFSLYETPSGHGSFKIDCSVVLDGGTNNFNASLNQS